MKHFKAPKTAAARRSMPKSCFLKPASRKYPVCPVKQKKPSCDGVLAAKRRATLNRDNHIAAAALRLAKKLRCSWAI